MHGDLKTELSGPKPAQSEAAIVKKAGNVTGYSVSKDYQVIQVIHE